MNTTTSPQIVSVESNDITNSLTTFLSMPALDGLFTLVAIKDHNNKAAKTFNLPSDISKAAKAVEAATDKGCNVYWSVNPPKSVISKKPKKSDIAHVRIVHVDIDPDPSVGYEDGRAALLERVTSLIEQYSPTLVIDSGNGIQLFWVLPEPVTIKEGERYNLNVLHAVGGDKGTHNADRIMRVPGTLNFPSANKLKKGYPSEPSESRILHLDNSAAFDAALFPDVAPAQPQPKTVSSAAVPPVVQQAGQTLMMCSALHKMCNDAWIRHLAKNQQIADNLEYVGNEEQNLNHSDFLMSVLMKIAFFFQGDEEKVREVFEATGFAKCINIASKWCNPSHILCGEQYADYHIGKAIEMVAEFYDPYFSSDAKTMLSGNQDDVALLIGRRDYDNKWLHIVRGGQWCQWTDNYWCYDLKAGGFDAARIGIRAAIDRMKAWVQWMLDNGSLSKEEQEKLIKSANRANCTKREKYYITDIYTLLSKDSRFTAATSQFDKDNHLLGAPGCTIDLSKSNFATSDPQNFISKQTACAPAAGAPVRWLQFLDEIFAGDQEVVDFIQILCGYALTGEAKEEKLFFLYGIGANGKSKFLEILTYIWKDYATRIAPKTLLNKGHPEHPTEIAKLAGSRLVLGSELPAGETWDDQKLKELTGGDTITGRFMRQDYFDFSPQFTLLLAGNHVPKMKHVGEAERRRFVLIPFDVTIPPERRDPDLGKKLKDEAGQILTWCIKGAGKYYSSGLKVPASIIDASNDYLDCEDVVGEFLKTQLIAISGKEVDIDRLEAAANDWFNVNNHNNSINSKSLKKELKDRGNSIRRSGSKYYLKDYDLAS